MYPLSFAEFLTAYDGGTGHSDYKSMKPYIDIATRTKSDAMAKIAASWEEED